MKKLFTVLLASFAISAAAQTPFLSVASSPTGATGSVTSVSVTPSNGVTGTVTTATTTPAIALSLGAITPTMVNKVTITAPATGSTLTISDGKTLAATNSITLSGTDSKTYTFPTQTSAVTPNVGSMGYAALVAGWPCNGTWNGFKAYVTDWGASGAEVRCNGTRWLPVGGRVLLKHLGAGSSGISSTSTIVLQTPAMPAGTIQANDTILFDITGITKSGTTDTLFFAAYAGTAGTTADTAIANSINGSLSAASVSGSSLYAFKIINSTNVARVGAMSAPGLYSFQSSNAAAAAVGVTDLSTNALIFSYAIKSGGTTDTVGIQDGAIWQIVN